MNTYKIEYEIPPLRAIYFCEVDADNEAEARRAFAKFKPGHNIHKIEMYDRIKVAREAILDELKRRWKEDKGVGITAPADISRFFQPQTNYFCGKGKMACPICHDGKLHYERSPYNGHVHVQCTTDGCVFWKE